MTSAACLPGGHAQGDPGMSAGSQPDMPLPADHTSQRLNERSFFVRRTLGQPERAPVHVNGRDAQELRESARVKIRRVQRFTDGVVAGQAVAA